MNQTLKNYHEKLAPFMEYMEGLTERPALEEVVEKLSAFDISALILAV